MLLSSASGGRFNVTSWKVFSIDEGSGEIELISSTPTSGTVYLGQAQGYNNAVYLLNEACINLYSGNGVSARSIKIEDIEKRMTDTSLATAHSYTNAATYGNQVSSAYTGSKNYPIIYAEENLSVINGTKNETGLGMSTQSSLIGRTDNGAKDGKLYASTSIQPYLTYWYKDNSFMQTAFKAPEGLEETDGTTNTNYNLIMPNPRSTTYWVASRSVQTSTYCNYCVRYVWDCRVGGYCVYYSNNHSPGFSFALRPVVSLSSELIGGDATRGWFVEQ